MDLIHFYLFDKQNAHLFANTHTHTVQNGGEVVWVGHLSIVYIREETG